MCLWLAAVHFVFLRPHKKWPTFHSLHSLEYQNPSTVQRSIKIYHDLSWSIIISKEVDPKYPNSFAPVPRHFQLCPLDGEGNVPGTCSPWAAGTAGTTGTATGGATSEGWCWTAMALWLKGATWNYLNKFSELFAFFMTKMVFAEFCWSVICYNYVYIYNYVFITILYHCLLLQAHVLDLQSDITLLFWLGHVM